MSISAAGKSGCAVPRLVATAATSTTAPVSSLAIPNAKEPIMSKVYDDIIVNAEYAGMMNGQPKQQECTATIQVALTAREITLITLACDGQRTILDIQPINEDPESTERVHGIQCELAALAARMRQL